MKPRVNYIEQLNYFWRLAITENFTSREISLYLYLLHVNNTCNWKKSFSHNNKKIETFLGVSFKTLVKARRILKAAGLLDFQTQNGSPNVQYQLQTSSKFPEVRGVVGNEVRGVVGNEVSAEISKTKEKQNNILKSDDVFNDYLKIMAEKTNEKWRDQIYLKYKLRKGSLQKLGEDFIISLKISLNEPHNSYEAFIKHFINWLSKQQELGKLDKYRDSKHKKSIEI